jgi:hypothetical protein
LSDPRKRGGHVVGDFSIGQPHYHEVPGRKDAISLGIVLGLVFVNGTIDFDHDAESVAVKIGNETVDDLLPAEVQPLQTVPAQTLPQLSLFVSHLPSEFSSPNHLACIDRLSNDDIVRRRSTIPFHGQAS